MDSLQFINHASVSIKSNKINLLTDPWYFGSVFHDGWNLIYENSEDEIIKTLNNITHIWISHEHPDHFSVPFFIKFKDFLKEKSIKILFQKTKDKRVIKFLNNLGLNTTELEIGKEYLLDKNFKIKCIKFGFYDSAILINLNGKKIFNLNDCDISNLKDIIDLKGKHGTCDVLLTQFSYAAWKGDKNNQKWEKKAAEEKINTILNQANILNAKTVIPFASFIKFSNIRNHYLNRNSNTPDIVKNKTKKSEINIVFFKPYEEQELIGIKQNEDSMNFWRDEIKKSNQKNLLDYKKKISSNELNESFTLYRNRIFKKNSYLFIKMLSMIPYMRAFNKIIIKVDDLQQNFILDLFSKKLVNTNLNHDISMSSESLNFIFKNSFGFDTLTVNGCFDLGHKNGFIKSSKILAIENLNNLGIYFDLKIFMNLKIFKIFFNLLSKVKANSNL